MRFRPLPSDVKELHYSLPHSQQLPGPGAVPGLITVMYSFNTKYDYGKLFGASLEKLAEEYSQDEESEDKEHEDENEKRTDNRSDSKSSKESCD